MSDDETELASSESLTEHAHAWSLDNWADNTVPYLDMRQRTTMWLRVCVALTAVSVAGLIGVLLFVFHGRTAITPPAAPETRTPTTAVASAPVAPAPVAAPTVTETKTVAAAPPPAPAESASRTFVICGDGREGVVGGHTSCLFAENVRRAFYAADDGANIVAFSPVTGERYEMTCAAGYRAHFNDGSQRVATRCVGGDDDSAEVVVW
jgi:hypothetical protein